MKNIIKKTKEREICYMKIEKEIIKGNNNCYCNNNNDDDSINTNIVINGNNVNNKSYLPVKDLSLNSILTRREIEVLRYVVLGLNNEEIGKELYISNNTIKIHIKNIMYKLNKLREVLDINNNKIIKIKIKNRIQLAVIAIKYGIVEI